MAEVFFYKAIAFVKTTMKAADSWKVSPQSCVRIEALKVFEISRVLQMYRPNVRANIL